MYQKEIVYLNLFENDIKGGCVGYLKIEQKQGNCSIELQVKNVPNIFTGNFPIRLQGENDWKEADMLSINNGYGKWSGSMSEAIARVEILLTDSHRIKGESKRMQTNDSVVSTYNEAATDAKQWNNPSESSVDSNQRDNSQQLIEEPKQSNNNIKVTKYIQEKENKTDVTESSDLNHSGSTTAIIKAEKIVEPIKTTQYSDALQEPASETPQLYESKWEQLLATYDQIHPYGDNRIYVKLEPKDFVILRSNYQHLVNNSFLLHGFYNYRYVILGKEKDFYIGVPGVFYEREKMVALMFGFEAFECEGGDAEEGKFGYYLRKVEI